MKVLKRLACAGALAAVAASAAAAIETVDFRVRWTHGWLGHSGPQSVGSFSYDTARAPAGGGPLGATDFFVDLSFEVAGHSFDETTSNTGSLIFDPSGRLVYVVFGTTCWAGGCETGLNNRFEWSISYNFPGSPYWSFLAPGTLGGATWKDDRNNAYIGGSGAVVVVPEPATSCLWLGGTVCLLALRARRRSAASSSSHTVRTSHAGSPAPDNCLQVRARAFGTR